MKHVLITGGAGFIGSHLCDLFLARGYAVTALDNLITGRVRNLESARLAGGESRFDFVEADASEPLDESKMKLIPRHGLHGVLHFACPASPVDFDRIPFEILKVGSLGTLNTVGLAQKHQARYLLASTSEVYGDPLEHPQKESYWGNVNSVGPRACYDESKRFAEAVVSTASRLKDLNAGIVRIFNTYGPRMRLDDGRIVPELIRRAIAGEPLTIHGTGQQTRSFCFVTDLVDGIFKLFESSIQEPVNIGNPTERTVLDFAEAVKRVTGASAEIVMQPARIDDPLRRCPDISKAKTLLHWNPRVDLDEGLRITAESFRAELS
jgi:dTDP-glucose 4,6-dehydratase